jgi:hypothetical protein
MTDAREEVGLSLTGLFSFLLCDLMIKFFGHSFSLENGLV